MNLSVVIPAKNESKIIGRTLKALKIALGNWKGESEVILVDNGSDDNTREIAKQYACMVLIDTESNISGLRNLGASHSSGNIIVFLDADCVVAPDWVERCLENFNDKRIAGVGTRAIPDLNDATWVEKSINSLMAGADRPDFVNWLGTSNLFIRRNCFFEVNGFDEDLKTGEDVNFCKKLNKKYLFRLEKRINTIHLRESKTLSELFKREFWRGKSSIMTLVKSEFDLSEVPSLAVPTVYLLLIIILPISFFLGNSKLLLLVFLMIMTAPVLFLIKNRMKISLSFDVIRCYLIGFVYLLARSCAIFWEFIEILAKYCKNFKRAFFIL